MFPMILRGAATEVTIVCRQYNACDSVLDLQKRIWLDHQEMAREFKPVRFFVLMTVAAFIVCGVTAFYTHRAEHGRTNEERSAYAIGERAGNEAAAAGGKLPTAAGLNIMAQEHFKRQGSGNQGDWDLAFEHGYEDGFKKTHPAP